MSDNFQLQDQDIIRIPVYQSRTEIVGEVKRPGIYELRSEESFKDLLNFSGDFTENAFRARVKVLKNTEIERKIADISSDKFSEYRPNTGDKYFVDRVLERFLNRVSIVGAVFRPGDYELEPGLTISKLINKAEGLKEDAFRQRAYITRLKSDNQTELISVNLIDVLNGGVKDIPLLREDVISISSIFDLKEEYKISIDGEIRQPGVFDFAEKMTLEELILKAGGFTEAATSQRVEVSRRVKNSNLTSNNAVIAQVFQIDIDQNLNFSKPKFELQPFDIISVRSSIGYEVQRQVKVEGEVLYPGMYTIVSKDERVSDLLKRAGGLTALAYAKGASLKREGPAKKDGKNAIDQNEEEQNKIAKLQRLQENVKDTVASKVKNEVLKNVYVGIKLDKIIENPGTQVDLLLEEGDILRVPKQLQTVKVNGEILYPVTTIYSQGKGFKHYISQGGGFSNKSLKRRSYVIYANGSVKNTSKVFLFNNYPAIEPGAELFIPQKEDKRPLSAAEIVGISSGLASLAVIILNLVK
jgi:protein involved in polysaccharide export with SLBB domain